MKTIIHLETTDEERRLIGVYLDRDSATKRLVTRKELTELISDYVNDITTRAHQGEYDEHSDPDPEPERPDRHSGDGRPAGDQGFPNMPRAGDGFYPSRGDEPYLYTGKHPALTEVCGNMLDLAEQVDQLIWETLEKDRER